MKAIITAATAFCAVLFAATGCNDTVDRPVYNGPEYVMFQDTLTECYVTRDANISIDVAATTVVDYDRVVGVEIVAKGSTAIEDYHFNLMSDNVIIKAGERTTQVEIKPHFEHFNPSDSLGTVLRLVVPQQNEWNLYGVETKVTFAKFCDFDTKTWLENEKRELDPEKYNYANYIFYVTFPISSSADQFAKSLVKVVADPKDPTRLIIKSPFQQGRDLKINLVEGGPEKNFVTMLPQEMFFTTDYGWVNMSTNELYPSYYNTCDRYIELHLNSSIESVGSFGIYPYYLEWITERAAEEIRNNGF